MPVSVTMPRLGESVTEGTVTRWLKQEGDRVEVDEPLLEVSTDKVDTEIPSPAAGVLSRIVVREDETAEVGSELAQIADEGESPDGGEPGGAAASATPAQADAAPAQADAAPAAAGEADAAPAQADASAAAGEAGGAPAEPAAAPAATEPAAPDNGAPEPAAEADAEPAAAQPATEAPAVRTEAPATDYSSGGSGPDGGSGGSGGGTVVTMPALGESVTEGTVTRWLKQVGDPVAADEPLLEVSTDKVDTEIPAPAAGTLLEIKVAEDETVAVGAALAVIGSGTPSGGEGAAAPSADAGGEGEAGSEAGGEAAAKAAPAGSAPEAAAQSTPAPPAAAAQSAPAESAPAPQATAQPATAQSAPAQAAPPTQADGAYVTPLVRKLATEQNVDLSALRGTGVGGRIRKQDVLEAAERQRAAQAQPAAAPAPAPAPAAAPQEKPQPSPLRGTTEKVTRLRAIIAKRMVESLQVSAQLTTVVEVDVTRIARLRDAAKADFATRHGVKLSFLPFFALATVEALQVHPKLNASIDVDAGTVTYFDAEHLAVAVDTERGLLVPVIQNAGDLSLSGLAKRIADLADRTRTNKVTPDELSGGTFTLTNTGSRGALFDTPIINQPQVAILGTGAVVKRAVVVEDQNLGELILPRSMMYLALSYDHRLVDGADAARFLQTIKERLEGGNFEAELGLI